MRTTAISFLLLASHACPGSEPITASELAAVLGVPTRTFDIPALNGDATLSVWIEKWAKDATSAEITLVTQSSTSFQGRLVVRWPTLALPTLAIHAPPATSTCNNPICHDMAMVNASGQSEQQHPGPDGTLILCYGVHSDGCLTQSVTQDEHLGEAIHINNLVYLVRARVCPDSRAGGIPTSATWDDAQACTVYTWDPITAPPAPAGHR